MQTGAFASNVRTNTVQYVLQSVGSVREVHVDRSAIVQYRNAFQSAGHRLEPRNCCDCSAGFYAGRNGCAKSGEDVIRLERPCDRRENLVRMTEKRDNQRLSLL